MKIQDQLKQLQFAAHTPPKGKSEQWQTMRAHTRNVARLAAVFAGRMGAAEIARWCGLLHDIGKYSDEFQRYLKDCHEAETRGGRRPMPGSAKHKEAGAKRALETLGGGLEHLAGGCVLGHHGGLSKRNEIAAEIELVGRAGEMEAADRRALSELPEITGPAPAFASVPQAVIDEKNQQTSWRNFEMLTRLVFSCLVDADILDSERHFNRDRAKQRRLPALGRCAGEWLGAVRRHVESLQGGAKTGEVKRVRAEVFQACVAAGERKPGLFTLTVPTGGGKTLASLAFALSHAVSHSRTRIIYAIPYTSIVEQTARVFRDVLGDRSVVEHHSAMEWRSGSREDKDGAAQNQSDFEKSARLAAENWRAPLIVTTTVQLFESLFSNQTSRCRKLHNLAGSVIILDEAQTLPLHLLKPLASGLDALLRLCDATVVLCTATQPAITGQSLLLTELAAPPTAIIEDPAPHFEALRRVTYRVERDKWSWNAVGEEMARRGDSCMAVLNTKKDALALLAELGGDEKAKYHVRHLSTLLCGAHRRAVLSEVGELLAAEREHSLSRLPKPVLLVATQVVEAGVDIDFPRVLRAKGPLDRMIQAAGRCNREGSRPKCESEVVLFDPESGGAPQGDYSTAIGEAWNLLTGPGGAPDLNTPEIATAYFAKLYNTLGKDGLDRRAVQKLRVDGDFPEIAKRVRLIDDDTVPVLVPYYESEAHPDAAWSEDVFAAMIDLIRGEGMSRERWSRIQPLTVAVRKPEVDALAQKTLLEMLVPDQLYLWTGRYDPLLGIGGAVARAVEDFIIDESN